MKTKYEIGSVVYATSCYEDEYDIVFFTIKAIKEYENKIYYSSTYSDSIDDSHEENCVFTTMQEAIDWRVAELEKTNV